MNWLDWCLLVILAGMVIEGLFKGFTRQVLGLIAAVVGLLGAIWFYHPLAHQLLPFFKNDTVSRFLAFLVIFIGVQLVGALLGWLISKFWKAVGLSWLDRLLGGAFGVVKAALIATAAILVLTAFPVVPVGDAVAKSRVAPYFLEISGVVAALAPQELKDEFKKGYDEIRELWNGEKKPELPHASA